MDHTRVIRRIHLVAADQGVDPGDLAVDIAEALAGLSPEDRAAVVRHAYWWMPQVPTEALHGAVGGADLLRVLAGRGPVTGTCRCCGRAVRARSRDAVDEDPPALCPQCHIAVRPPGGSARAGPGGAASFGWEFQEVPQPWQPQRDPVDARARRWAEDYPDRACA